MSQKNDTNVAGFLAPTTTGARTAPATMLPKAGSHAVEGITTATELNASTANGEPAGIANNPTRTNTSSTAFPSLDRIQPNIDGPTNVKPGHNPKV